MSDCNPYNIDMSKQEKPPGIGTSIPLPALIAALLTLVILVGGVLVYQKVSSPTVHPSIVIATGPQSGVYHSLGAALQRVLRNTGSFDEIALRNTDGSAENMTLIAKQNPEVDLAFVQADSSPSTNARLITVLYDEVLHILVSKDKAADIRSVYDLQDKRVALGPAGSGTRDLSRRIIEHFHVEVAEDLLMSPQEAAQRLREGTIDAAFMLTAIPSQLIADLARDDAIRFISLGDAGEVGDEAYALELVFPGIASHTIPRATYTRLPVNAVHTISVSGQLVAHKDLDEDLVRTVTASIFDNRTGAAGLEGDGLSVARKIRENYDPALVTMAYHPGAAAFYRREEPPFFVEYAEALSFGLTLLLAIYSVSIAVREWIRRRMKNRVDAYLIEVETLTRDCASLDRQDLLARQRAMEDLRRAAFADLVEERLLADEAFIILQNHLRDEFHAIEALLADPERGPA